MRDYWTRQFAAIDGRVEPQSIEQHGDQTVVTVHQTVRTPAGELVDDRVVTHTYTIRDGRITRMDVED